VFRKVLVANRGEIAVRVIRTLEEMGIGSAAIYSEADRACRHVRYADEAYCIGPPLPSNSYLRIDAIVSLAKRIGAEAVHPGYGFLAENAAFAKACEDAGLVFIGPASGAIALLGDKMEARRTMSAAGIPVVPGGERPLADDDEIASEARRIGFPVMMKAAAGGGGKGMRVVREPDELAGAYATASAEAQAAFGNGELYLEKLIVNPRHIEVQLAGDARGHVVHFYERDCSVQRRHQKLIEESPSPVLKPALRRRLGEAAVKGATRIGYRSLGTMEFLLDADGHFYFMEMNTRLQVEHGVTELVTGEDLVKLQIRLAAGEALGVKQSEIVLTGHAIECRINAEDPRVGFRPSPGTASYFYPPGGPGVRMDTHVYPGYAIPPQYDSLIGKIVAHGRSREEAIARMRRALDELVVEGVATTAPFHREVMRDPAFLAGEYDTGFAEKIVARLVEEAKREARPAESGPAA